MTRYAKSRSARSDRGGAQQLGVSRSTFAQRNLLPMPRAPHAHGAATALPAVWPPALTSELNGSYSEALYGAAGRLPADLRVVWPSLLSDGAPRAGGRGRVPLPPTPPAECAALHRRRDPAPAGRALGVPAQRPSVSPTGTTLEVAHCAFAGVRGGDLVRPNSPMWFFVVPGSGVSVDVGRTLHASPGASARRASVGCTRRSCPATTAIFTSSCAT